MELIIRFIAEKTPSGEEYPKVDKYEKNVVRLCVRGKK